MKNIIYTLFICGFIVACNTTKSTVSSKTKKELVKTDTVTIANDELEYEIIIIEPGFNAWLAGIARPEGYYSQQFLENRNMIYVNEWNNRVNQPQVYDTNLYELRIDYESRLDYGYDVNYQLYNYFLYFQLTYNQKLGPFVPRI